MRLRKNILLNSNKMFVQIEPFKVDTQRKSTISANYGQIIYGWKDFPLKHTNNVLKNQKSP